MTEPEPETMETLDERLAGAAGAAPAWRAFTAEAMQAVHRRAVRRQRAERLISVTCGVLAIALAVTTFAALRPTGGDAARTVRTADDPAAPSDDGDVVVVDPAATTTTRPSFSFDGHVPVRGEAKVTASSPVGTVPPATTPTTGPTPSTTAPAETTAKPPVAYAALNGVEVQTLQGASCWQRNGSTSCDTTRSDWLYDAPVLEGIQSNAQLWFRWGIHEQPLDITVSEYFASPDAEPATKHCEGGNPCHVDFPAVQVGTDPYWYVVTTRWKHGTVNHAVKVRSHPVEP